MRVLVTGGAGFIGSHVVDRLVQGGHDVVVLDNLDPQVHGEGTSFPQNLESHMLGSTIEFRRGDLRDSATVRSALEDIDAVAHLAAAVGVGQSMYAPDYYTSVNVHGQGVLLEALVQATPRPRRLVVASSMSIYGEGAYRCAEHGEVYPAPRAASRLAGGSWDVPCPVCEAPLDPVLTAEDKPPQHTSIYAITKKTQEEMALCFGSAYGIPTLALRFFNVYGSRQALSNPYTGVAAIFMGRLKKGRPPLIFEDGHQSRDLIHVSDVADAIVRAIECEDETTTGALNVCTGRPRSIRQVAEILAERLGVDAAPRIVGRYRVGDIRHCIGDPGRARERLSFEARVRLPEGVDELIRWSEEEEVLDRVEASFDELVRQGLVQ